ncbi:glucuronate isomerase [Paenibacillus eucommiae]|uniref:Glucuronate isomerase n=1 Tax=Paenibacillus eucommiae TaxID=1355755 RepID=A0ABS4J7R4_9BACL|nr:glucuronate isomerase [Paenibacillus eucommiae]MBP1995863.1 hypothetical protein [Paenibacillus eucommiae]
MEINTSEQLAAVVKNAVQQQKITDMHTHLFSPNFDSLLHRGVDELLTYHYLVAEVMRWSDLPIEIFWQLTKSAQADHIWQKLFIEHSPVSEACRGVLTTLQGFGIDLRSRDLDAFRQIYAQYDAYSQVDKVLELAGVDHVVMTNDPFDEEERGIWLSGTKPDPRFHAALRLDPLLNDYAANKDKLHAWGYQVEDVWGEQTVREISRFLQDWIVRMNPLYMAVSLPPDFAFPEDSDRSRIIEHCILPVSRGKSIPFAMMIGVTRAVNPALRSAGDSLDKASLEPLAYMLRTYPHNKFMTTYLSRENQHELCVLGRKFRNLFVFGCWWFLNSPALIEEVTRMRFELLGLSVTPQHSDARVLDQLIYKWKHSKEIISMILLEKYKDILRTGWVLDCTEIERDVADLLHNNFWRFLDKSDRILS